MYYVWRQFNLVYRIISALLFVIFPATVCPFSILSQWYFYYLFCGQVCLRVEVSGHWKLLTLSSLNMEPQKSRGYVNRNTQQRVTTTTWHLRNVDKKETQPLPFLLLLYLLISPFSSFSFAPLPSSHFPSILISLSCPLSSYKHQQQRKEN